MLIEVSESSRTGEARRHAVACAQQLRFKEEQCGAVAIATTELATNLVKHAQNGRLMIQPISQHGHSCLRVIAIDSGPGIPEDVRALLFTPFFSTKRNGRGLGLTLVQEILNAHGFEFSLETGEGGGAEFRVGF